MTPNYPRATEAAQPCQDRQSKLRRLHGQRGGLGGAMWWLPPAGFNYYL